MAIVVSKNGEKARKFSETKFRYEDTMQEYIKEHPEVIPVDELGDGIEVFVAAREFPTQSGPIDAIGFDKNGDIYIIETKLYKNPDKRIVLGQVLDYGASLWQHGGDFVQFSKIIDDQVKKHFDSTLNEKLNEFFKLDEENSGNVITNIETNLNNARFKFIIVMDHLDDRLKDLISFLNTNSKFDVYAVQLEYYKVDEYEIVIPKLFGNEVKKLINSVSTSNRKTWDNDSFLEQITFTLQPSEVIKLNRFYKFAEDNRIKIKFGTGTANGSYSGKIISKNGLEVSLYHIYTNGDVVLLSEYWAIYLETKSIFPDIVKQIVDTTGLDIDVNLNCLNIDSISNEQIDKLLQIYEEVIIKIQNMNLTKINKNLF